MLDYNIYCGKNPNVTSEDWHCEECQFLDKCYLILPYDPEFRKTEDMVRYYVQRKEEAVHCLKICNKFISSDLKEEQFVENLYNTIMVSEPVVGLDNNFFYLIHIPKVMYILVSSLQGDYTVDHILTRTSPKEFLDLTLEDEEYQYLHELILNRSFKTENNTVMTRLLTNLKDKKTIPTDQVTDTQIKKELEEYKNKTVQEWKEINKKEKKQTEREIRTYDKKLSQLQLKLFRLEKRLRKQALKEIKQLQKNKKPQNPKKVTKQTHKIGRFKLKTTTGGK